MSMTEMKVSFPTEKLDALRFFMNKKQQIIEMELHDYLDKTYEKLVPAQVREYVESRMEQTPVHQTPEPEQIPVIRERSARQNRRQREQVAPEPALVPETTSEAESLTEQENQGITMNM